MRNRYGLILLIVAVCLIPVVYSARAQESQTRTFSVSMTYPEVNYKNRLVNAKVGFKKLQEFFSKVQWKPKAQYSFLRDVIHYNMQPSDGYVMTEKGYGFGLCGASSILNKLVQTATYLDGDGTEKPLFETVLVWTWKGDPTYGKYGSTIFLGDSPSSKRNKDYVWTLNKAYNGVPPKLNIKYDDQTRTVTLTATYSDESPDPTATPRINTPTPTLKPTIAPTKVAGPDFNRLSPQQKGSLMTNKLVKIIGKRKFGAIIIPVGDSTQTMSTAGFNQDEQLYVASAFKGPVAIYFFENVSESVWNTLPIEYWNVKEIDQVPSIYRDEWTDHHSILNAMYMNTVYSENDATGNILQYVYDNTPQGENGETAITAFNNWSQQSVGVSDVSGIYLWWAGKTNCKGCEDKRYGNRKFYYGGKWFVPTNTYSPRDLALYYVHLGTKGHELGYYDKASELLSILPIGERSYIEIYTQKQGIKAASKDGFVGPYSDFSDGYYISTDAGLLTLPSGEQFAVAFMAFDAGDLLADSITTVNKTLLEFSQAKTIKNATGQ
jgi:hypothetical protein